MIRLIKDTYRVRQSDPWYDEGSVKCTAEKLERRCKRRLKAILLNRASC